MDAKLSRQRTLIVRLMLAAGCVCIVGLWMFEAQTGLLSAYDKYAYPLLLSGFVASLLMIGAGARYRAVAEWTAYLSFVIYCAAGVCSFRTLDPDTRLYTIANTLQWMPLMYVTAFLLFPKRQAILAAAGAFALAVLALSWLVISEGPGAWTYIHGSLILNAYAMHLLTLLALSLFIVTQEALDRVRRQAETLESAAFTDPLTGVANRRGLERMMTRHAEAPGMHMALILLDMDHFKQVNDRRGHLHGDRVLQAIVHRLRQGLREDDVIGRWGGDEFLVLAQDTSSDEAQRLAERLRKIAADMPRSEASGVTLSAGVSLWDGHGGLNEALRRVDAALYVAKHQGRDQIALADGMVRLPAPAEMTIAPQSGA
ncbi:MAG: hypothetical protein B7Y84_00935 [Azorhizobium sp. 32-67-21]|nr:MAG: hypothetical protein B7Z30_12465 [Rhizobiales bacterium 12-68-15]OYX90463.1 MAG: hypothetical protein B7Y84_00935 [Azorhizobium sp. 32-67-21]